MAEFEPKQFGKFFLLDKLAVGGMAEIYKAKTFGAEGFEKMLAIKRILPHCAADKDFISMLIDEAKLSVLLSHANVVQVYDLGKVGDDFFISMEYINGVNLRDLVYRCRELGKAIPTDIAVYIISEICKGLDYAHRKTDMGGQPLSLVHRDISPQNILISYEGEVKIVDFGIAKAAMNISHTMAGILKGKIAYMSPEQALGKPVDHRTDIFSAGILFYECLTNEKLFNGESQFEVLKKIRSTKIDMARLPVSIPKPLQVILARTLAYFPKDRFQSAGDMQIELTKYLYSTHHDFSPQKLAGFVREVFSTQIAQQRQRAQSAALREAKTGSISLAQEALQEEIVHRDSDAISVPLARFTPSRVRVEDMIEPTDKTERQPLLWRLGIAGSVVLILASVGFIYWQILHPRLFPPMDVPAPIETPQITLQPVTPPVEPAPVEPPPSPVTPPVQPAPVEPVPIIPPVAAPTPLPATPVEPAPKVETPAKSEAAVASLKRLELEKQREKEKKTLELKEKEKKALELKQKEKEQKALEQKQLEKEKMLAQQQKEKEQQLKATEKPAATGGVGSIKVNSSPSGAEVFINGEMRGTTPLTVSNVPSGTVKIILNKDGLSRHSTQVSLSPGESKNLGTVKLGDVYGEVAVSSNPPRASVFLDGNNVGATTPVTIRKVKRDKSHHLRVTLEGHQSWETSFTFGDDKVKKFNVSLEAK